MSSNQGRIDEIVLSSDESESDVSIVEEFKKKSANQIAANNPEGPVEILPKSSGNSNVIRFWSVNMPMIPCTLDKLNEVIPLHRNTSSKTDSSDIEILTKFGSYVSKNQAVFPENTNKENIYYTIWKENKEGQNKDNADVNNDDYNDYNEKIDEDVYIIEDNNDDEDIEVDVDGYSSDDNQIKVLENISGIDLKCLADIKKFFHRICETCNFKVKYRRQRCPNKCPNRIVFQCKICFFTTELFNDITNHVVQKCARDKFLNCPKCDYGTIVKEKLIRHIRNTHFNSWKCPGCGRGMDSQTNLNHHVEICKKKNAIKRKKIIRDSITVAGNKRISEFIENIYTNKSRNKKEDLDEDKLIALYCATCLVNMKKSENNKTCPNCSQPLLWECVICKYRIKSYCGIYDHIQNDCNKPCCYCKMKFVKKQELVEHYQMCGKFFEKCPSCNFESKSWKSYVKHLRSGHTDNVSHK